LFYDAVNNGEKQLLSRMTNRSGEPQVLVVAEHFSDVKAKCNSITSHTTDTLAKHRVKFEKVDLLPKKSFKLMQDASNSGGLVKICTTII